MSQEQMRPGGSRATNSVLGSIPLTDVSEVINKNSRVLDKVRVTHGANQEYFDIAGKTVGSVRKSLRNSFSLPGDAAARVDGKEVGDDHVLASGQNLEFSKDAGVKG